MVATCKETRSVTVSPRAPGVLVLAANRVVPFGPAKTVLMPYSELAPALDSLATYDTAAKADFVETTEPGTADISFGSATMTANVVDVTLANLADGSAPIPAGSTLYATFTSGAEISKALGTERLGPNSFRIYALGTAFNGSPIRSDVESQALVAGTANITMLVAVVAGQVFSVEQLVAGGGAAAFFSVFRKDADELTVFAHNAAGAVVATNTSTVRVHNFLTANPRARATGQVTTGGTVDIALTNAVGDLLSYELVTSEGTAANHFSVFRVDNATVRVFAHDILGAVVTANRAFIRVLNLGPAKVAEGTNVAGTIGIPLVVAASDQLSVIELVAGGGAANSFHAVRKDADEVTVFAFNASGVLVATNTSRVLVINHGQPAAAAGTVRWVVQRPLT